MSSSVCTFVRDAGTPASYRTRLPITTADVLKGDGRGLHIQIYDGTDLLVETTSTPAVSEWNLKRSALCNGVELHSSAFPGHVVSFYLDDPDE